MKTSERLKSLKQAEPFVLRLADGRRIPEIAAKHMRIMPGGGIPAPFAARVSHLCGQLDSACSTSAGSETFQHVLPRSACRIIPTLNRHAIVPGSGIRSG